MRRKRITVSLTCAHCGATFTREKWHPSQVPKYCSSACIKATRPRRPLTDRFWEKVNKTETCWLKRGAAAGLGYGVIGMGGHDGKNVYAHVLAWFLATGHWPTDKEKVCHACDVPRCVRNDEVGTYEVKGVLYERRGHLWLGTDKANADDKVEKGRSNIPLQIANAPRGERNYRAKLTDAAVTDIRNRYAAGGIRQVDLAEEFGVGQSIISSILRRKNWTHV